MTNLFTIELTINMPDGGRHARHLLNLYIPDMPGDINEAAYNLCDANEDVQAHEVRQTGTEALRRMGRRGGTLKIFALLSVSGEDSAFIKQVFAKFMDGFPDYLKTASGRHFSSTGFPPDISLQPTDWNAEVHQ